MKKVFALLTKRELLLYLFAVGAAYITTLAIFQISNYLFDLQLKKSFNSGILHNDLKKSAYALDFITSLKGQWELETSNGNTDYLRKNDGSFQGKWKSLEEDLKNSEQSNLTDQSMETAQLLKSSILYGISEKEIDWHSLRRNFFWPVIPHPSLSLDEVSSAFDKAQWGSLENYFSEVSAENIKGQYLEVYLSELLDNTKRLGSYTLRRYLNGDIQFVTFWVAITALIILVLFFVELWIEKRLIIESVDSFDLPDDFEQYSVGQFQQSIVKLQDANLDTDSRFVNSLINTASTFGWRGKAEAENTLNIEVSELREDMDSRFGLIRYFAWAVPSIGFIGTVIGIGNALGDAHNVIGQPAEFQTKGAIQQITGQLGVAFDTTLISLLLSIILVLFIHILSRKEELLITTALNVIKKELLQKIAPLEKSNLKKRFNLLLESLKNYTTPAELQTLPFKDLKDHLENKLQDN